MLSACHNRQTQAESAGAAVADSTEVMAPEETDLMASQQSSRRRDIVCRRRSRKAKRQDDDRTRPALMALFLALREEMRYRAHHCLGSAADVVEGAGDWMIFLLND